MAGPLRFGVISTAQIGLNRLIPAAQQAKTTTVTAISSRDKAKAEAAAKKLGIEKAYGAYEEVLRDPDIDAVINPLPNSMHAEWTIKAAEAGKHILCEKPLATTVEDARRMAEAAKANNVVLVEGFTHRWNPQLRFARDVVAKGQIGEVRFARSEFGFSLASPDGNIRMIPELGGGGLFDAGCYSASALRFVLGEDPQEVHAYQRVPPEYGVDTALAGVIRFGGDRIGYLACGMDMPRRCFLEVTGTRGRVAVTHMFEEDAPVVLTVDDKEETHNFSAPPRFVVQAEKFAEAVVNKTTPEFSPEDAIQNVAFIRALKDSANAGQPVKVAR